MSNHDLEEENRCLRLNCQNLEEQVASLQEQLSSEADYQKRLAAQEMRSLENKLAYAKQKQCELWNLWNAAENELKTLRKEKRTC